MFNNDQKNKIYYRAFVKVKLGKFEEALEDYNKVIELNPKHVGAFNNRGYLKGRFKNFPGALKDRMMSVIYGNHDLEIKNDIFEKVGNIMELPLMVLYDGLSSAQKKLSKTNVAKEQQKLLKEEITGIAKRVNKIMKESLPEKLSFFGENKDSKDNEDNKPPFYDITINCLGRKS